MEKHHPKIEIFQDHLFIGAYHVLMTDLHFEQEWTYNGHLSIS